MNANVQMLWQAQCFVDGIMHRETWHLALGFLVAPRMSRGSARAPERFGTVSCNRPGSVAGRSRGVSHFDGLEDEDGVAKDQVKKWIQQKPFTFHPTLAMTFHFEQMGHTLHLVRSRPFRPIQASTWTPCTSAGTFRR